MSHATYYFLVDLKPPDEDDIPLTPAQVSREFVDQALEQYYHYRDRFTDENNSAYPLFLVNRVGRGFAVRTDPSNGLSLGDEIKEIDGKPISPDVFDILRRKALYCIMHDSFAYDELPYYNLGGESTEKENVLWARLHGMSVEELVSELMDRLHVRVAGSLRHQLLTHDKDKYREVNRYKRVRMTAALESLEASTVLPFTYELVTPERYRAYDLREEPRQPANVNTGILLMDIPT
jgi:hypothetical protein